MTKAQARAWCRAQKRIIAAWAKEQRLKRMEALRQEVAGRKKRADEECKRKVAGAKKKAAPKKVRKAAPKKKAPKKRAAPRPRKKAPPRPRKKAAKPKARKRAPKRKGARKKASRKKATARGAPARSSAHAPKESHDARAGKLAYDHVIERIRDAVRAKGVKRFGEKVFIGSVWSRLRRSEPFKSMGRDEFNHLLVHAHQQGDLRLSRADLVSAMNRSDVDDSEIAHMNATFHFLSPEVPAAAPDRGADRSFAHHDFEDRFGRVYAEMARRAGSNLVTLASLRNAFPEYNRAAFDRELRKLREADQYVLQTFDGRHGGMTAEETRAGIREGGRSFVFVAARRLR